MTITTRLFTLSLNRACSYLDCAGWTMQYDCLDGWIVERTG